MASEPLPQDMRDLLIRLDQTVKDGFAEIRRANSDLRNDHRELTTRVDALEHWKIGIEGQIKGATKISTVLKSALAVAALLLTVLGYQVFLKPVHPVVETATN